MRIFHATWPTNVDSILAGGIEAGWDQQVYFANQAGYAAGFLRLRSGEIAGVQEIEFAGRTFTVPNLITHDRIAVITVDTELLDADRLSAGTDHNPEFYPDDLEVIAYRGDVPAFAIVDVSFIDFN